MFSIIQHEPEESCPLFYSEQDKTVITYIYWFFPYCSVHRYHRVNVKAPEEEVLLSHCCPNFSALAISFFGILPPCTHTVPKSLFTHLLCKVHPLILSWFTECHFFFLFSWVSSCCHFSKLRCLSNPISLSTVPPFLSWVSLQHAGDCSRWCLTIRWYYLKP